MTLQKNARFDKGLSRLPFTEESLVQVQHRVQAII